MADIPLLGREGSHHHRGPQQREIGSLPALNIVGEVHEHVLMLSKYKHVDLTGERTGLQRKVLGIPPLLLWRGSEGDCSGLSSDSDY